MWALIFSDVGDIVEKGVEKIGECLMWGVCGSRGEQAQH